VLLSSPMVCSGCLVEYLEVDGWDGYCAACYTLIEEHARGEHGRLALSGCADCLRTEHTEHLRLDAA